MAGYSALPVSETNVCQRDMLAGITFSIFREHKFLSSGSACRRLVRGMVEDSIPGLHAVGILTVLGQDSFQGSLESVNHRQH